MKYQIGTKWIMTNPNTNEQFEVEVLDHSDPRIKKIKMPSDICMYCEELQWGTTYDAEFLDTCCKPA